MEADSTTALAASQPQHRLSHETGRFFLANLVARSLLRVELKKCLPHMATLNFLSFLLVSLVR